MAKSSSTPPPTAAPQPKPERRSRSSWGFFVVLFRLLLLGLGGTVGGVVGLAVAQVVPGNIQDPPLVERLLRGSRTIATSMADLTSAPEATDSPTGLAPEPIASASPAESPSASPSPDLITTPPPLTPEQRQQAQTQLTELQQELQTLNTRAAELERQVGIADATAPLEERLGTLQRQLDPNAPAPASPTASASPAAPAANDSSFVAPVTTRTDAGELMVTLPIDALFNADQKTPRPSTNAILDSLVTDLQSYPGATIRVSGHTDSRGEPAAERVQSLEQATAIQTYLADQLGADYHWVAIGYGSQRPLVDNTSEINRQRNRRIEIVIEPEK